MYNDSLKQGVYNESLKFLIFCLEFCTPCFRESSYISVDSAVLVLALMFATSNSSPAQIRAAELRVETTSQLIDCGRELLPRVDVLAA